jgi:putative oxidoreductase
MAAYGLPMTGVLLTGAIATELLGGVALFLGLKVRWVAVVLAGFLLGATLVFHTNLGDQQQLLHFLKNLSILGGLVLVVYTGAGPYSLHRHRATDTPDERAVAHAE